MTKKAFFSALLVFCSSVSLSAQVGIMGRRLLVKTDIINGLKKPVSTVEAEFAVTRSFTVSVGYTFASSSIKSNQRYESTEYWLQNASLKELQSQGYPTSIKSVGDFYAYNTIWNRNPGSVGATNHIWGFAFNFYNSSVISAPYGRYTSLGFKHGKQELSGHFFRPLVNIDPLYSSSNAEIVGVERLPFSKREVRFTSLYIALGHQYIFLNRFTLDWQIGGALSFTNSFFTDDSIFASIVAERNGSNLWAPILSGGNDAETLYGGSGSISRLINPGFFFNVKAGILLF